MSSKFFSFVMIFFPKITDFMGMSKKEVAKNEEKKPGTLIVERIDERARELGITRPDLSGRVKVAKNTFSNWEARGTIPPSDVALIIADELKCSVRWLVTGKNDKQEEYSLEEKNLISKYRTLDKQGQFELKALLEAKTIPADRETIPELLNAVEKKQSV